MLDQRYFSIQAEYCDIIKSEAVKCRLQLGIKFPAIYHVFYLKPCKLSSSSFNKNVTRANIYFNSGFFFVFFCVCQ